MIFRNAPNPESISNLSQQRGLWLQLVDISSCLHARDNELPFYGLDGLAVERKSNYLDPDTDEPFRLISFLVKVLLQISVSRSFIRVELCMDWLTLHKYFCSAQPYMRSC